MDLRAPAPNEPSASVVLPCARLEEALAFFQERLGFRLDSIFPADAPRVAVLEGLGVRVRLDTAFDGEPGTLFVECDDPTALGVEDGAPLVAPNGTRIVVAARGAVRVPEAFEPRVIVHTHDAHAWNAGRAGMEYRDLIPGRLGGRLIASHIRIPHGGPVPDYVHYHRVGFQAILCLRGWVRVVYEDQGEPFELRAGDCVLQPPEIRHRVLECSDGLEVLEVSSPAEHPTFADPVLTLPNASGDPSREFGGQCFVRHAASNATWTSDRRPGFEARDTGIGAATRGVADVRAVRFRGPEERALRADADALAFAFVTAGTCDLEREADAPVPLRAGDAVVVPAAEPYAFARCSADLAFAEVTLPMRF